MFFKVERQLEAPISRKIDSDPQNLARTHNKSKIPKKTENPIRSKRKPERQQNGHFRRTFEASKMAAVSGAITPDGRAPRFDNSQFRAI